MSFVTRVARRLQSVMTVEAEQAAARTRVIRRQRKLTGPSLAQGLVFGWMQHPDATLEQLSQMVRTCGADITAQALDQRFTPALADFLQQLLESAVSQTLQTDPIPLELLRRFEGVYLTDSTVILLPNAFSKLWPGCGGSGRRRDCAVKLQVRLELSRGQLLGPELVPARTSEQRAPLGKPVLPPGALWLADLGYFNLDSFRQLNEQRAFFISRLQSPTAVYDGCGHRLNLLRLLRSSGSFDLEVEVGTAQRLPCRLLAWQVNQSTAARRRRAVRRAAVKHGFQASPQRLAYCAYDVVITNTPQEKLTLREASVLLRARWQVEMLFKLWKTYGRLDESRSQKPWRQLLEVYAKLIGLVIQHWILLTCCWDRPHRSCLKACRAVQDQVLLIAYNLFSVRKITRSLEQLRDRLARCATNIRNKSPSTYQLLANPLLASRLT